MGFTENSLFNQAISSRNRSFHYSDEFLLNKTFTAKRQVVFLGTITEIFNLTASSEVISTKIN